MAIAASAIAPAGCQKPAEEERVWTVITDVRKAAEGKEIRTVLGHLSKAYRDPQGNDREGIKGLLAFYFFRHRAVSVYLANQEVAVRDGSARATFQAVLSGRGADGSAGGIIPEAMGVYDFDVSLALEKGEWKVISAAWTRAGAAPEQ